jgi:hypothetical protein
VLRAGSSVCVSVHGMARLVGKPYTEIRGQ